MPAYHLRIYTRCSAAPAMAEADPGDGEPLVLTAEERTGTGPAVASEAAEARPFPSRKHRGSTLSKRSSASSTRNSPPRPAAAAATAGRASRHGAAGQPRPRFPRPRGDVHHGHRRQRPLGRVCRRLHRHAGAAGRGIAGFAAAKEAKHQTIPTGDANRRITGQPSPPNEFQ